jgi:predicted alpha/beta hydrolase family esterase
VKPFLGAIHGVASLLISFSNKQTIEYSFVYGARIHTIQSMSSSPIVVFVPGWKNSGPGHWQSLWASRLPGAVRVEMSDADWLHPKREVWIRAISHTILNSPRPVVVAAHSLGCIATAHLPSEVTRRIGGALLVAPADPDRRGVLSDFSPVPYQPLPYRSVVVASAHDPYCPIRTAGAFARSWGSELMRLQNAGHINVESGHGEWPLGLALLESLLQGHANRAHPSVEWEVA